MAIRLLHLYRSVPYQTQRHLSNSIKYYLIKQGYTIQSSFPEAWREIWVRQYVKPLDHRRGSEWDETEVSRLRRDREFLLSVENKSRDMRRHKDQLIFRPTWAYCFIAFSSQCKTIRLFYILGCLCTFCSARLSITHIQFHLFLFALIYILITNAKSVIEYFGEH